MRWNLLGAMLLFITVGVPAAVAPSPAQAAGTSALLVPAQGPPGQVFRVFAGGFGNGDRIIYWFTLPDLSVRAGQGMLTTNDKGDIEFEAVPPVWATGTWYLTLKGIDSGREAIGSFVTADPSPLPTPPFVLAFPASVPAGAAIHFYGAGFQNGEDVSYWVTGPTGYVQPGDTQARVTEHGDVWFTFTTAPHYLPGRWAITAEGSQSGPDDHGVHHRVFGSFEVTAAAQDTHARLAATAPEVLPNQVAEFVGSLYAPEEDISFWATAPDGRTFEGAPLSAHSNERGEVRFSYRLPRDAQPGAWAMSAYGFNSRKVGIAYFTVRSP